MRILVLVAAALLGSAGCATSDFPRRATAQEIANVEGIYGLSDGYRAHIFGLDSRLYVRIGAGPQKELRMLGPDQFATASGDVAIEFQPEREDDAAERIVVEYERDPGGHPPIRFASGMRPGRGFVD